jgi:hypothetical protein
MTLSPAAKTVVGPSVHVDDQGAISVAWMQEDKEIRTVLFARAEKPGGSLGQSVPVNGPKEVPYYRQEAPALLVDGDSVFVTWALSHPKATPKEVLSNELRLSRSLDGGRTFLPSVKVNDDEQVIVHSFDAIHRDRNGRLHIAWIDGREGKKEPATFITRSADGGETFERNLKLDENACVCCRTAIASGPDGMLYVAWRKVFPGDIRETVVAHSTDGGQAFSPPVVVGHDRWVFPACPHRPASIGVDRFGRLYVVWYTEGEDETPAVYLTHSDDRGMTFSPKQKLNVGKGTFPDHPQLAVDPDGRVVVVWEEQSPVRREVVARVSVDRGETFTATQKLNEKKGQSPAVSVNAHGVAAIGWMEHTMLGHKLIVQSFQLPPVRVLAQDATSRLP